MKRAFNIEVDCANCANLMEQAARKVEGVSSANVNFMALKLFVEFDEGADAEEVMKQVRRACRRVEPDCDIKL